MQDELCYLTAVEAITLFKKRALSPVELTQALIDRDDRIGQDVNGFTVRQFEQAMEKSREAENRYMGKGDAPRPLEGVTVTIKDSSDVAGQITSYGSLTADDTPKTETALMNQRLFDAGAIQIGRSTTPEFSSSSITHSRRWGVTRNPWNLDFTSGGSSGGAGALLAAGTATLATGSDIAGSIRIPASCCGVVGYKPPRGRVPVEAPFNLDYYCHNGPMARSVADTLLFQNTISGPHFSDPTSLPRKNLPVEYKPIKGWKIAWSMDFGFYEVDDEVKRNTLKALEVLRQLGATVEEVDLRWTAEVAKAANTHLITFFGSSIKPTLDEQSDLLTSYARSFAQKSVSITPEKWFQGETVAGRIGVEFNTMMQGYDLFVAPTTALPAVPAEFDEGEEFPEINGRLIERWLGWVMTVPFNMMSSHPVLSVPSGRAANGVPTGVQLVGPCFQDEAVFQAAHAYESAVGGWFKDASNRPVF
jgi:amidase